MIRLALFISGGGTTACAIINACRNNLKSVRPVLVVASKENISGITGIKNTSFKSGNIAVVNPNKFAGDGMFADKLLKVCRERKVDLIGQYGWLPLTPKKFISEYRGRIINQHPGPLDSNGMDFGGKGMYGRRVHAAVLYFRRVTLHDYWTEATTHMVSGEFDRGKVIGRGRMNILPEDTVESLQAKGLPVEHRLQIDVLKKFADGKIKNLSRPLPLIKKSEYRILKEAKKIAALFYPYA